MRAAVIREGSPDLVIEDVLIDIPGPNEVLIQTAAAGLCHSDLHYMDGRYPTPKPAVLGHEAAGIVQAVGSDVRDMTVGDHVITCISIFCGTCDFCLTGRSYLCANRDDVADRPAGAAPRLTAGDGSEMNQLLGLAAFAEEMLVHQNGVVRIDPEMPLQSAALVGCAVTTGVGAVTRSAGVGVGATVAILGCGGVGISAVQGAHLAGARQIIAIDLDDRKLEWAKQLGATHTINATEVNAVKAVKEMTSGGVEYSFECIGFKETAEQAYSMIRAGGTATILGMIAPGVKLEIWGADLFIGSKTLQGCLMGSNNFKVDMPHLCDLYMAGRLKLDEMVSAKIALEDINEGFTAMTNGDVVRSVVDFSL